ncbi:hypothetical protein N0V87_010236 [Didymella glomerata]|uniref:Uncharacterized protein n=1 Tax=Didymella glomerata TaxID=749621 RepID=A0A9W8WPN6_9PLEO|nr:hypothetical protein N0V87_010236 [Didymella glomerata]
MSKRLTPAPTNPTPASKYSKAAARKTELEQQIAAKRQEIERIRLRTAVWDLDVTCTAEYDAEYKSLVKQTINPAKKYIHHLVQTTQEE